MIKYFCDCCGVEITQENKLPEGRMKTAVYAKDVKLKTQMTVEVITGLNEVYNTGDFCKHCVLDALKDLDDRPEEGCRCES